MGNASLDANSADQSDSDSRQQDSFRNHIQKRTQPIAPQHMSHSRTSSQSESGSAEHSEWCHLSNEELLDVRMNQLNLRIEGTILESRIERLYSEMEARNLRFRPHFWLSDEWFSPDGVPGIAIPFYLAHPRLARLENHMMLEVEGAAEDNCMRILRHETGHTIETAYRLYRRRRWQDIFGKRSQPYPEYYQPKPYSRNYVHHLDMWYAQSHPCEDFAETFAVWMKPRSRWRTQYEGWAALKKLQYVDELMHEIGMTRPQVSSRQHMYPLKTMRKTLREHYADRRSHYGIEASNFNDSELRKLFSDAPEHSRRVPAASFLRQHRVEFRRYLADWTGQYQYTIDEILTEIIRRCEELGLRLDRPPAQVRRDALVMLTVQVMNYLHNGHHQVAL